MSISFQIQNRCGMVVYNRGATRESGLDGLGKSSARAWLEINGSTMEVRLITDEAAAVKLAHSGDGGWN
ncbi:hypothetical protein M0R45_016382 [Rubus argutus]|uniref:Uncharacterized protein n=1 Tax=Rubus argutus TaxID=59490 RepID=A0AAW1XT67_RUBAR